jgi:hypothetical protein
MTVTRPSQLRAAECQLLTPGVVKLGDELGLGRVADVVHGGHVTGADGQAPVAVQQHPDVVAGVGHRRPVGRAELDVANDPGALRRVERDGDDLELAMGLPALVPEVGVGAVDRSGAGVRDIDQHPMVPEVRHHGVGVGAAVSSDGRNQVVGAGVGGVGDPEDLDAFEPRLGQRGVAGLCWCGGRDRRVDGAEHQLAPHPDVALEGAAVDLGQDPGPCRGGDVDGPEPAEPGALIGDLAPECDVGEERLQEGPDGPVVVGMTHGPKVLGVGVGVVAGLGRHRRQQQADNQ